MTRCGAPTLPGSRKPGWPDESERSMIHPVRHGPKSNRMRRLTMFQAERRGRKDALRWNHFRIGKVTIAP
jgi:hypothetical protein